MVVVADTMTNRRPKGFLGMVMGKPEIFENENSARVVRRIIDAADQIAAESGGVIVIDQSSVDQWPLARRLRRSIEGVYQRPLIYASLAGHPQRS